MIGDHLPDETYENGTQLVERIGAEMDDTLDQLGIALGVQREMAEEQLAERGPTWTGQLSLSELARMPAEERAAVLGEGEELAGLAAVASGELMDHGFGEGADEDSTDFEDGDDLDDEIEDFTEDERADDQDPVVRIAELEGELAAMHAAREAATGIQATEAERNAFAWGLHTKQQQAVEQGRQQAHEYFRDTHHVAVEAGVDDGFYTPEAAEVLRRETWRNVIRFAGERVQQLIDAGSQPRSRTEEPSRPVPATRRSESQRREVRAGRSAPAASRLPEYAFDKNGFPTERFEREVRAGRWLGAAL